MAYIKASDELANTSGESLSHLVVAVAVAVPVANKAAAAAVAATAAVVTKEEDDELNMVEEEEAVVDIVEKALLRLIILVDLLLLPFIPPPLVLLEPKAVENKEPFPIIMAVLVVIGRFLLVRRIILWIVEERIMIFMDCR